MRRWRIFGGVATAWLGLCLAATAFAQNAAWSPEPWLADLAQMRVALHQKYANLEWLTGEREVDLNALFDRAAARIRAAHDDAGARSAFDRLVRRIGDGHVDIAWPAPPASGAPGPTPAAGGPAALCRRLGYDSGQSSPGIAPALAGYRPVNGEGMFATGIVAGGGERVGIVRIPVFQPQGSPAYCEGAIAALAIDPNRPCDDACEDRILTWAYECMTGDFEDRLRRLRSAGATVLIVDISGNGGGSEWAEAAARSVSPVPLTSERRAFVRGEHWASQWRDLAASLRNQAASADPADRVRLLGWAAEADAALRQAQPCPLGADCARIGRAGYMTGLVGTAPAGAFAGRGWAAEIFSPAQYPYHDHVWTGPLIVLVDQETWSAAEEFAPALQDNRAAIVMGARTGGAGCGHTNGGTPTLFANSGATLSLPDCVRLRADGSNEVRGVIPDELVGLRADDGNRFRAGLVSAALGRAVARARALHRRAD
jgi:hypothetical protein